MDDEKPDIKSGEALPAGDDVYRIVLISQRDRRNKAIPSISCFSLNKNDDNKLSVEWNKKTTPEETLARVGASYKYKKEEYKPFRNREIYSLDIGFVCSLEDIEIVIYDPIQVHGNPMGIVDNPAHSLIVFKEHFGKYDSKEPEVYFKLRQHAKNKRVNVDMKRVEKLVEEYRGTQK